MNSDCVFDLNRGIWQCPPHPWFEWIVLALLLGLVYIVLVSRKSHDHDSEWEEKHWLHELLEGNREIRFLLHRILGLLEGQNHLALSHIKLRFGGNMEGPVTLPVGKSTTATVDGFDQFGAPWTGPLPPVTFSIDNASVASSTPNADGVSDVVAGVAEGVANLTASLTTVEGLALSDAQAVTVSAPPPPPPPPAPVLSSIKLNFSEPA